MTITSSLKMFDGASGPLKAITQAMNLMLSAMDKMQDAANRNTGIDNALAGAKAQIVNSEADIAAAIEQAANAQERLNATINQQPEVKIPDKPPEMPGMPVQPQILEGHGDVELFKNTGMERFKSEMLDAQNIMERIQAEQAGISIQASSMDILPPEAKGDIETVYQHMRSIDNEMESIASQKSILNGKLDPSGAEQMSAAYETLKQELNTVVGAQQNLNAAMRQGDISTTNAAYQRLHQQVDSVERDIRDNINAQKRFNNSLKESSDGAGTLLGKIKGMAAAYLTMQGAKQLGLSTIGAAMQQQKMEDMFVARTGSESAGKAMFSKFKSEALQAGQDVNQALQGTLSFFSATQNTDQLSKLNNITQRLSAFDSAGNGIEGAAFALKEAMSGDIVSLAERFNMSKADIRAFKIDELGKSGNVDGFIKAFNQLLEKQKMGQEAFDQMMTSPVKQAEVLGNNVKSAFADAGAGAMMAFLPLIKTLNQAFKSGQFQGFFDALSIGLNFIAQGVSGIVNGIMWLGSAIQQNWDIISPILIAVGAALALWGLVQIPGLITKLWGMVTPILEAAAGWLLMNWPILLIGAAIGLLIFAMLKFGDTVTDVIGVVGGIFGTLFAWLFNKFAYFANIVLSVAEFFINVWKDPIYAVKKLFYDLAINALSFLTNIAKGIENVINKIPGLKVDMTSGMDNLLNRLEDARNSLKSEKDVVTLMRFQQMDYGEAFGKGQDIGRMVGGTAVKGVQDAFGAIGDKLNSFKVGGAPDTGANNDYLNGWNKNLPNIDKVGEVGKIKDTVDISSEDLKTMRELAEMKNIQNFVTLQPSISMTHTGNINNGYDIETIKKRIEESLKEEIASSARSVFVG